MTCGKRILSSCRNVYFRNLSFPCHVRSLSRVWLFATPWTVACQASLSMGFPRQKAWSGLPGIEPTSAAPALVGGFFATVSHGKPMKRFAKIWVKLSIWSGFQPPYHCCIPLQTLETALGRIQRLGFGVWETRTKSHFQLNVQLSLLI